MLRAVPSRFSLLLATAVSLAGALAGPGPALASCAEPAPPADAIAAADAVFVGTVTATANLGRRATVAVEELWAGPALAPFVQVAGGPDGENTATSVDRSYDVGARYLFVVRIGEGRLIDNACSATQQWSVDLAGLRPVGAVAPHVDSANGDGTSLTIALGVVVGSLFAVGLVGGAVLVRRRPG